MNNDGLSPAGRRARNVIFFTLFAIAAFLTRQYWLSPILSAVNNARNTQQPAAQQPVNPGQPTNMAQPGDTAIPNVQVPAGGKQKLTACIVNFGPYFPVLLIPNTNPVYDLEIVPLNFYETAEQLESGQFINEAAEADQIAMLTDGRCDLLFTTVDVIAKHPTMGKLIAIIGQSDGADKTVAWNFGVTQECLGKPINIFNDAVGCRFAVAEDSVGYKQTLSFLKLASIPVTQVHIDTYSTPEDAIAACLDHGADICSGWTPSIYDMIIEGQSKVLVDTQYLKTIYDGIFASHNALQTKSEALLAFEEDWFRAVKMTQDDLAGAADTIQKWTYNGANTNEYTFVYEGSATDDFAYWFDDAYAQAGFDSHFVFNASPDVLYDIMKDDRETWEWAQIPLGDGFDPKNMVDLSFFQKLSGRTDLSSQNPFVNNTFSPFPSQSDQVATREQLIALPTLVEIVCPDVFFRPGKTVIAAGSPEEIALVSCGEQIKTLVNQSNVQILIIGSAAWPDPAKFTGGRYDHCGEFNDLDYCADVAKKRAAYVLGIFTGQLHLPGSRFAIDYRLGEKTDDQAVLQDNRFVTIQVKVGGLE